MLESMTGFAVKESTIYLDETTSVYATFMLKSLNGRHFEAHCKLPQSLSMLETQIIKRLKTKLHRGSVYFTVHLSTGTSLQPDIRPSLSTIEQYLNAIKIAQKELAIPGEFTVSELVRLPGAFETYEPLLKDESKEQIFAIIEELVDELVTVRMSEGEHLQTDLLKRISDIKENITSLEPRALEVMEKKKNEVHKLITQAQEHAGGNEINAASAFYTALDKIDIHEEITRFKGLLEQLKTVFTGSGKEKGKKIDFTLQELFREVNTITAKCSDSQISKLAINIKVELEKAREITQNIL